MIEEWMADARCAEIGGDLFFPEIGGSTDAKKICTTCEVRAQCLQYALDNGETWGTWGGLNARELRKLRLAAGAAA
ncbi:WhiB family transcriptional regulator [Leifsonia sp. ZF2019]|uniref:WhiB family transcriptional regulator n=1 Tax=Leifsonia sp. ZF2019 TaxID=2781978 RepID=UPI001CBB9322|nr:WhiB family transcriptional regulator [Leifsonia sp. ZF2019]UAJ78342.1 WhiB family transcriptional regulator [Leifsonia sp. ZF2019]